MMKLNKNLIQRTLAGILLVALIVGAILWNEVSFVCLFTIICVCSVHEFHKITNETESYINPISAACTGGLLFISMFLTFSGMFPAIYSKISWSLWIFCIILLLISELYRKQHNPINNWGHLFTGQIYVAMPFGILNALLFYDGMHTAYILLALFVTIWSNDTFAYVFGSLFGRHKMFQRISPKKTWEGFAGGAAGALISGYVFSIVDPQLNIWQWLVFSQIIVVFGTYGDLLESLMKRTLGIKDSGNVIPGHGGWLDRFDSMLLAAPAIAIYLTVIR